MYGASAKYSSQKPREHRIDLETRSQARAFRQRNVVTTDPFSVIHHFRDKVPVDKENGIKATRFSHVGWPLKHI